MKKRVLVADDFDDVRRLMKYVLEVSGYEVIEAMDGYQAVERAVSAHPDIILMDIAMPVMDGIQATQAIRQHETLADIPILALTAYGDYYVDRALDVGCTDVIQKPVDINRLEPLVSHYVH